jgi:hypothetical protein
MIIKKFKLFEEISTSEFSKNIDEYLYPFADVDFTVFNRYPAGGVGMYNYNHPVLFSKIKNDLESLLDYISSETDIDSVEIDFEPTNLSSYSFNVKRNEFEDSLLSDMKDDYLIRSISIEF